MARNVSVKHCSEEEIVITGISGRLPESRSIEEFKQNLFNGVDMVTFAHEKFFKTHKIPPQFGRLKDLIYFDAPFFGVHAKQAEVMEPQQRMLLEVAYEALIDAGINPNEVRGTKTGVFIGASDIESPDFMLQDPEGLIGYELIGACKSFFANRISYALDLKGPSCAVDTACSSSLFAFHQAVEAIKGGQCDSAFVGGISFNKPISFILLERLGLLAVDGKCRSFDSTGSGYVKADAVVVVYLQKANVARRVYATVLGVKSNNDGYKELGITFPSREIQNKLIMETFDSVDVGPEEVCYVEAHAPGTPKGDPQEVNAIVDAYCNNRKNPLLIGSVKSNMGHAEAASGLCALVKVLIAMDEGCIPQTLHFKSGNTDIPALHDGRLQVVTTNKTWEGGVAAINCFGFGGINVHVLLKSNPKPKFTPNIQSPKTIPRVIGVSGRTRDAVNYFLSKIDENKRDREFLALVDKVHSKTIPGHLFRGYAVLNDKPILEVVEAPKENRPVAFVFSGMGSQWKNMAKDLMVIETFRHSIRDSSNALKPYGINLEELLVTGGDEIFSNILNSFICITGMQLALTDVLVSLNIKPDIIVGHSMGEIGCAYADGCFTREQAILVSYCRGRAVVDTELIPGAMAAIGLTWEQAKNKCPSDIYPVCHNSEDNVTISGPADSIEKFINELQIENIFAKVIKSTGRAFHCKYVVEAAPKLMSGLETVIPNPKPRTTKWISSSIPEPDWYLEVAQKSSAEYHVNNFISPVLFYEALKHVPEDAIAIEIAPHGLMQAIVRKALGHQSTSISLMKQKHPDNTEFFLSALGKIYNLGIDVAFGNLYEPIEFPVGKGTTMINLMIQWDHSVVWKTEFPMSNSRSVDLTLDVNLSSELDQYLRDHIIDARIVYPPAGYLIMVWKTFAKLRKEVYENMSVLFEDIKFHRITVLPNEGSTVQFVVNIFQGSGSFEICEDGSVVVTGQISIPESNYLELNLPQVITSRESSEWLPLDAADIYKALHLRGFDYKDNFKSIVEADNQVLTGKINWNNNWVTFVDGVLQFFVLGQNSRTLQLPTRIRRVLINPLKHFQIMKELGADKKVPVSKYQNIGIIQSAGVEVVGIHTTSLPRIHENQIPPKMEHYQFIPYENNNMLSSTQALAVILQTVLENSDGALKLKITEVASEKSIDCLLASKVKTIFHSEPMLPAFEVNVVSGEDLDVNRLNLKEVKYIVRDLIRDPIGEDAHLVITSNLVKADRKVLTNIFSSLKTNSFVLLQEPKENAEACNISGTEVICRLVIKSKILFLLRKTIEISDNATVIFVTNKNYSWVEPLKEAMKQSEEDDSKIYLIAQGEQINGLPGMVNCLVKEPGGSNIRSFFIQDKNAVTFTLKDYASQLRKDLVHNFLRKGEWGCYRHFHFSELNRLKRVEHACVKATVIGDLKSLRWIENPVGYSKNPGRLCHIYYSSLNLRDVMLAVGKLFPEAISPSLEEEDCVLGSEFSGKDSNGKNIMCVVLSKGLATTIIPETKFLWEVPEKWSLEDAATVPVAYMTAYYALILRGQLKPGETILIHGGAGAVAQASISIALRLRCKVFTTVSSEEKIEFLKERFPQLLDNYIGNSRNTTFEQLVLEQTEGRGVDIVLNSLIGEQLQASVRCLAPGGRFLELGKVDMTNNSSLGMSVFLKNVIFNGISLDTVFDSNGPEVQQIIDLVKQGIGSGVVQPLPRVVYKKHQLEKAFRLLAGRKYIGKVLVKIREEEDDPNVTTMVDALCRSYMDPDKSYILIGGLGGFGLELTNWLISRRATKIILVSRTGIKTGYQSRYIRNWEQKGIQILVSVIDSSTEEETKKLLEEAGKLGPVGGIFNVAMVLHNDLLKNLSENDFKTVCKPKVNISRHLDLVSREMAPTMDYFVNFSSLASGRGNITQANYGLANSALERIVEAREAAGYPGIAIQWGLIGDVGLMYESNIDYTVAGTLPQSISSCLATLDLFLQQRNGIFVSMVVAEKVKDEETEEDTSLVDLIADIIGFKDASNVPPNTTLTDLGMDSLMGAEIKQVLECDFNILLNAKEIRRLTFGKLAELQNSIEI